MKQVAKVFIFLSYALLYFCGLLLPIVAIIAFIVKPDAFGAGVGWEFFSVLLVLYELSVVIGFGLLAIVIENHINLQKIAEAVTVGGGGDHNLMATNKSASNQSVIDRREPSIAPLKVRQ